MLKIACHNINGLKGNRYKIESIAERIESEGYDIIGLVETNISEKEGQYIVNQDSIINSFWTSAEEGKSKGSGVGVLVNRKWAKHIGQVKKHNGYLLELHFFFRQMEIVVFIVYIAPNSQQRRKEVQRVIMREIAQRRPNMYFVVMGDFNHVIDPELDKSNSSNKNYKKLSLHRWLKKQDFVDTFRKKFLNKKEFS
jgi:exonuclease III